MRYLRLLPLVFFPTLLLSQTADSDRSTLETLLKEVRELRLALERSTLLTARTQIAVNMMQIQESRASKAAQDLDNMRKEILDLQTSRARNAEQVKRLEEHLSSVTNPNEHQDFEGLIRQAKLESEQLAAKEQDRRAKEAELSSQVQNEQSQLADLRARLGDMQRALDQAIQQTLQHN